MRLAIPRVNYRDVMIVILASLSIPLVGLLSFRLPFTPVPITFQVSYCLFLGLLLGYRRAFFAIAAFLLEGALGLPVFANGGAGLAYMMGPTGGYLLGYLFGGTLAGYLAEKWNWNGFFALCAGNLLLYGTGTAWLSHFVPGWKAALIAGVLPFIAGDLCKAAMFASLKRFHARGRRA